MTNGQTSTFTVTNGQDGASGTMEIKYIAFKKNDTKLSLNPDEDTTIFGFTQGPTNYASGQFVLDSENGTVTIGAGITRIKVTSIMQFYQNSASTRFSNAVKKNGSDVNNTGNYIGLSSLNQYGRVSTTNVVMFSVTQGDVITFVAKSVNSNPNEKDYIMGKETHFIIEKIK